ncbi:MAG: pyridoxamine 5'-phosphate oxidase family protein [Methanotrichaceae archaeon]|nr:pyridoxamine 5'-phosphate oxidase family protein [Methanotrichaceae archaeon]
MALEDKILQAISGDHVTAVATVSDGHPAVRFMALTGMDDFTLIGATVKSSRKVQQIIKNSEVALSIWSGKSFSDPYVVIQSKAEIHDDLETKTKYWDPKLEPYFQKPENPNYVVLKFVPQKIEYYYEMTMEIWER